MAKSFTSEIHKFLGLHEPLGDTVLKAGESPKMKNLKVTDSYTLTLREGFEVLEKIDGEPRGITSFKDSIFFVAGCSVYRRYNGESALVGELESDEGKVTFLPFGDKLYFLDGTKIKVWQGDGVEDISPYVPLVAISTDHFGAGVAFEDINLLTPERRQSFTMDSDYRDLILAEQNISEVKSVTLNGELMADNTYTVDLENGTVTLKSAPVTDPNAYEVRYVKGSSESEALIHRMRYAALWGGDNDTRIFLWGDSENPDIYRYSGVHDGMSGMDYFPELYFNKSLSGRKVTSILRHYDRLLVFTENDAYYSYIETKSDGNGKEYLSFPVRTLSSSVGCSEEGCALLALNTPITVSRGTLYRWVSTSIRDERNAEDIGERIKAGLREVINKGLSVFDREREGELYLWNEDNLYVYNYALDLYYYYEGLNAACFTEAPSGDVYFQRNDGSLCHFISESFDDGKKVSFHWETGYEDASGLDTKNIHSVEFELLPVSETSFDILWVSDNATANAHNIGLDYKVFDFDSVYFDSFSFKTAITPVRLSKRLKLKRCRGFKIILKSDENNGDFHLLSLKIKGRISDAK
ncbi:MAG: hypothetical protein IJ323_06195 [Clostridia bacterium]|nr:hypothetical protein [Clostridia bacterium]